MKDIEKMDEIADAAAAEQVKQLKFKIPEGAVPGTTLQVPHPDGKGCNCGLNDCFRCNIKPLQYEVQKNLITCVSYEKTFTDYTDIPTVL